MTEYREINGWPLYVINKDGVVKNKRTDHVIAQNFNSSGYKMVSIIRDGKQRPVGVHRLLALTFLPNADESLVVRHLDGNPRNNVLGNLALGTQSENMQDAVRHGTHRNTRKEYCKYGHKFTEENTWINNKGGRRCRICIRHANLMAARRRRVKDVSAEMAETLKLSEQYKAKMLRGDIRKSDQDRITARDEYINFLEASLTRTSILLRPRERNRDDA